MTVDVAKKLRQQQQQRIKAQVAPDGTPYIPRKRQPVRGKKNRIKREMFAKLRTSRYMKASGDGTSAAVEFTGKVQRIARIHQFGLRDRAYKNSKMIAYPERILLAFNSNDVNLVEDVILDYLNN